MAATTAREAQLEQRVASLEHVVAQLIRATYAAFVYAHGSVHGAGWGTWQRMGASHKALTDLHAHLKRHPAPDQE